MKNGNEVCAAHKTPNPEQATAQAAELAQFGLSSHSSLAISSASLISSLIEEVRQLTGKLTDSTRMTIHAQAEAIQAGLARDAANLAARAQNAKLMALTDHPEGLKLLGEVMAKCAPTSVKRIKAERDAYKWGYAYLQDRMHSLDRHGWAIDCDSEIEVRIDQARRAE